ncbi:hypothetical protein [Paraburkholderia bryophila]|uniref:Uncharacterized protein n=1 Tax=Paraburkholderia bryophila TaxID=420952 RepID=A0A7Y9WIE6_9BURK|nr:hypothetical protein [Paraburkholderia bryophila]NYH21431.1 hypothetical protein [Paraburkholderia bryophila]
MTPTPKQEGAMTLTEAQTQMMERVITGLEHDEMQEAADLIRALLAAQPSQAQAGEARNVEGLTRAEFESRLRIGYQHDNIRSRERGRDAPINGLTAEQEREIAERVELNYPVSGTFACPICGKDSPHEHRGEEIAKHRAAPPASPVASHNERAGLTEAQREVLWSIVRRLDRGYNVDVCARELRALLAARTGGDDA